MAKSTKQGKNWKSEREQTQPAEEWGERIATGRAIARGGGNSGPVPGATEKTPAKPAPPPSGKPPLSESEQKSSAVADAMARLGDQADPARVVEFVKAQTGIELGVEEAATIEKRLREHAALLGGAKSSLT